MCNLKEKSLEPLCQFFVASKKDFSLFFGGTPRMNVKKFTKIMSCRQKRDRGKSSNGARKLALHWLRIVRFLWNQEILGQCKDVPAGFELVAHNQTRLDFIFSQAFALGQSAAAGGDYPLVGAEWPP